MPNNEIEESKEPLTEESDQVPMQNTSAVLHVLNKTSDTSTQNHVPGEECTTSNRTSCHHIPGNDKLKDNFLFSNYSEIISQSLLNKANRARRDDNGEDLEGAYRKSRMPCGVPKVVGIVLITLICLAILGVILAVVISQVFVKRGYFNTQNELFWRDEAAINESWNTLLLLNH